MANLIPTKVYDTYWRFAAERHAMYLRRLENSVGPWTTDPILANHRFTNAFRATDRVTQYLIHEVQYGAARSQAPDELFFRTMLFKTFNKIETWEYLEKKLGNISWQSTSMAEIGKHLDDLHSAGARVYSAAYIMPSPRFGHVRKHQNHLALINEMMRQALPAKLTRLPTMQAAYEAILGFPGIGRFLAFQYVIDLNYSTLINFDEKTFVVAGPGAEDGISKCFENYRSFSLEEVIFEMTDRQVSEFERLNLPFSGLFGRALQPIDIQNLFCEVSKYTRVSHPEFAGRLGRTRIKQHYRGSGRPPPRPFFPPKWQLCVPAFPEPARGTATGSQPLLL